MAGCMYPQCICNGMSKIEPIKKMLKNILALLIQIVSNCGVS